MTRCPAILHFTAVTQLLLGTGVASRECSLKINKDLQRFSASHTNFLKIRHLTLEDELSPCTLTVILPNNENVVFQLYSDVSHLQKSTDSASVKILRRKKDRQVQIINLGTDK